MSDCTRSHVRGTRVTPDLVSVRCQSGWALWKWALYLIIDFHRFVIFLFSRCPRKISCSLPFGAVYPLYLWTVSHLGCIWDVHSYPWKKRFGNPSWCCASLHFGCLCDDSFLIFCKENWVCFYFYICYDFSCTGFCELMLLVLY